MNINYYEKNVYGNPTLYIADPDIAAKVVRLTGRRTITQGDIDTMTDLFGVTFTQVLPPRI